MAVNLACHIAQQGADVEPAAHMLQGQLTCLAGRLMRAGPASAQALLQHRLLAVSPCSWLHTCMGMATAHPGAWHGRGPAGQSSSRPALYAGCASLFRAQHHDSHMHSRCALTGPRRETLFWLATCKRIFRHWGWHHSSTITCVYTAGGLSLGKWLHCSLSRRPPRRI